ncbi:MAG: hypothetical protein ABSA93_20360 [Streptosporangiaceae bacterium]
MEPSYPGLGELQAAAMTVIEETGYGREVADNVRGFVAVRLASLRLGTPGRFLSGAHPLDFGKLLDANVVLEIEDCGDDRDKAFLTGAVLLRLAEHLRARHRVEAPGPVSLRHVTVVEEAHRLLRQPPPGTGSGPAAHAVEMFADLLAEIRAYGEGLIIAEQIPSKLIPDVIKNTAVKVVHRLPAADDRSAVGATMNLTDEQSRYLVTLLPGEAAVHADGMDYPLLTRMPDGSERETGPCVPAPPSALIGPRSPACPANCGAAACTLAQMRAAQRAAVADPRLTLWAELAVAAHLTGWPVPRPAAEFLADLAAMDPQLRDCALSHAVDVAVAARVPAFSAQVSAGGLAAHVAGVLRQRISDRTRSCAREEPEFLAPPWQWVLIRDALRTAVRDGVTGRHPRSDEWEHATGQPIPGRSCTAQLRAVQRRHARAQRDQQSVAIAVWGTGSGNALEHAVGTRVGSEDWASRLGDALTAFAPAPWLRDLTGRPPHPGAGDG